MELSVLIRTSNREESFWKLVESIPDWVNIIVSVDSATAKRYAPEVLKGRKHRIVEVDPALHFNEYFQFMYPDSGWIHCMDDDDYYHPDAFELIQKYCANPASVYIYRLMKYRQNQWKISPHDISFANRQVVLGSMATSNIVFHAGIDKAEWGAHRGGDYKFIQRMVDLHPSEWVDKILIYAPVKGRGIV